MGPNLHNGLTIFFAPHVPNFLAAPSSLVLMFSSFHRPPTCRSHAPAASPHFRLHSVLSHTRRHCVDLSPMDYYRFRWGPNFIATPSSNFFHYPCFTCYHPATWNLHFFCNTLWRPSMSLPLVYPSLHVSEFASPTSTFICHLAFVHPPWASSHHVWWPKHDKSKFVPVFDGKTTNLPHFLSIQFPFFEVFSLLTSLLWSFHQHSYLMGW